MITNPSVSQPSAPPLWPRLSVSGWTMVVVGFTAAAWLVVLVSMAGMDQGPGTPLHTFPVFLFGWIVMLTAMMLPSELNYIGAFAAVLRARGTAPAEHRRAMGWFVSGYGIAWIAYGLAAFLLDSAIRAITPQIIAWDRWGPILAGSVLVIAGLYQISSLKHACLAGCRSPMSFFSRYWRNGNFGAVAMGTRHGIVCVGCCWAMMAVMFAVGAMSLAWMAMLTVFMFSEKVLPKGRMLSIPIASFFWAMGIWIAVSPTTAPLFKHSMLIGTHLCHRH